MPSSLLRAGRARCSAMARIRLRACVPESSICCADRGNGERCWTLERARACWPASPELEAPDHWGPRFDLVIANILEGPLQRLAAPLSSALAPAGVLLLSGFTPLQTPALRVRYEKTGLAFVSESHLEEWALLRFELSPRADPGLPP